MGRCKVSDVIRFTASDDMLSVVDRILTERNARLGRFARPITRSEVIRELVALGIEALEPPAA
jgi:hypothetical protein